MRLWRRNEAPVGGWFYVLESGKRIPQGGFATGLETLYDQTVIYLEANSLPVPDYLFELIEDQICQRQPEGKCRYTKNPGDVLSQAIDGVAGAIDSVLGTNLKQRARRCPGCGKRRVRLNQYSR